MALQNRKAFTLVELLVVVVIISMLMALLLPAVVGARARARQTQCTNQQQELGKALSQYEGAKGYLPGYVNRVAMDSADNDGDGFLDESDEHAVSWVVMVFQYLGEGDLWKRWRDPNVPMLDLTPPINDKTTHTTPAVPNDDFAAVRLPRLICPTDDSEELAPLSYVVNCGLSDYGLNYDPLLNSISTTDDVAALVPLLGSSSRAANAVLDPAYGLFFNHTLTNAAGRLNPATHTKVTLDKITDGAQNTIMLTENMQASQWLPRDAAGVWRPPTQLDVGIVWWTDLPPGTVAAAEDGRMINKDSDKRLTYPADYTGTPDLGRYFARPSSAHSGGAVVTFADGHSQFQSEEIDYNVYQSLMTPEVSKARDQGLVTP